jgi:hypothetical protein
VDVRRAPSKIWQRLLHAGNWCRCAWADRAEDGRIRYAMAGVGLGLLVGSLTSAIGANTVRITWTGVGVAAISLVGSVIGLSLLAVALIWPWIDQEWAWERRRKTTRQQLITKADDDPKFREELKADPRQTFERELKRPIPDDSEITVIEETPKHRYIVLQPSVLSRRQPASTSSRASKWCVCAWTERAEDGRVSYGIVGLGLGLLVGSLLAVVGDNTAWVNWTDFGYAPVSFLGFVAGLCLLMVSLMPESWTDQDWSWQRRDIEARLIAKANCDLKFREQLKADLRQTIEKCGGTIRDGFEITVLEETPKHQYIVLQPSALSVAECRVELLTHSTASASQDSDQ